MLGLVISSTRRTPVPSSQQRWAHREPSRARGDSRYVLARGLFFANRGEFRIGDYEEIMNKASCLSLLSNAVLV